MSLFLILIGLLNAKLDDDGELTGDEDDPYAHGDITRMITEGSAGFDLDPAPASYDTGIDHGHDHGFETTHDYDYAVHDHGHDQGHGHDHHSHEHLAGDRETYKHGDHTDQFSFSAADIPHSTEPLTDAQKAAISAAFVPASTTTTTTTVVVSTTPRKAICQISDNTNNIFGWFNLEELQKASGVNGVRIWGKVNGLTENKKYGFHVHTNGVAAPKTSCANSGGIYNPLSKKHGLTCDAERMVGDL